MSVFLIADVKVTDESWIPGYAADVHAIVHRHGGKYLARSGTSTNVAGAALDSTLFALLEFPSMEAARAFLDDPAYAPFAQARSAGSVSKFNIIDDTDLAGTIEYLPKG